MIEGAVETANILQKDMKLKIGSTTGVTTAMGDVLKDVASKDVGIENLFNQ